MSTCLPLPLPGVIAIASLSQVARQKRRFDAILTAEDPRGRPSNRFRFNIAPYRPQLILRFEDVDDEGLGFSHANAEQVEAALAYGRRFSNSSLIVHCHHGVGRSAALGLAIMADRAGAGMEAEVVEALFAQRPEACPNQIVIALADAILLRDGALLAALAAYEARTPHMGVRRSNRASYAARNPQEYTPDTWEGDRILRNHGG